MKKLGTIIVIAFAIWFAYTKWEDLDANTIATVFTGLVIIYGYSETKKRETAARHFIEKKNAYTEFIEFLSHVIDAHNEENPTPREGLRNKKEAIAKIRKFKHQLIPWGGADIINAYNNYVIKTNSENTDRNLLLLTDDLLRAIRKDLGHDNARLKRGDLIKIFSDDEVKEF